MVEKLAVVKVVSEVRVVKTVKMAVASATLAAAVRMVNAAVRMVNAAWAGVAETASAVAKEPAAEGPVWTAVFVAAVGQRAGAQAWARAAAWGGGGGLLRGQAGLQLASVLLSAAVSPVVYHIHGNV